MLEKNKCYEIEIIDLGDNGEGIGKVDDFTVFVHGGIPGDKVTAKIIKVKKQYAIGIVDSIVEGSNMRQVPTCPYTKCGGCQTQMIDYNSQLELKKKQVEDAMKRIGGLDVEVEDVLGMEEPICYRNKSQYPVRMVDGRIQVGFYKQRTHDVVDIDQCMVQHPLVNKVMKSLKNHLKNLDIKIYNEEKHRGILRHIVTRISFKTKDMMLIFVTNSKEEQVVLKDLSIELSKEFPEIKSFIQNINTSKGNRVMGYDNITLLGDDKITDYIEDLSFEISPLSFLQVNPSQTEVLYNKALEYAEISKDDEVFDIYCGIGTISLFLAKAAKRVTGVELIDVAIKDAKENAVNNQIDNTEFHADKAEVIIPDLYKKGYQADVIVVDPPRKGCEKEVLDTILKMAPKKVVYVSCKPSTLARDLKILSEKYSVEKVQPVDLFPFTTHVETIVALQRN
ncbi:23S rRNA (uracil(1939)-C(5))-methyltransferase RlmD [Acidaminobacter sp. JC074]|uniref:23S rRNA (uracil(1939)-C(5))-methyltransferase RlmD n=1 Tax=Acidaminobacter sp. JC074 TaxID=2530199 RepID=UPI001F10DDA2|nr:23S rRNA (uracil(1939)-C(5))-methyltransferase RlmD [Acidaminobacter sp. JC074]MCH4888952.1 23S rRNA (uracil(1939)-C(5))-methyltransferase RlmD [Acidaminobacter sp. JC074]